MELIIFIILIAVSVAKSKGRRTESGRNTSSVDYGYYADKAKQAVKSLESSLNSMLEQGSSRGFSTKYGRHNREQDRQAQQMEAARRRELEERKKREAYEQRKRAEEFRKKQEEQKRKLAEEARKKKEEQEMLKKFGVNIETEKEPVQTNLGAAVETKHTVLAEAEKRFSVEEYLDPLTASFYPGNQKEENKDGFHVDDYLFPTLAPYYPKTDVADIFESYETWK